MPTVEDLIQTKQYDLALNHINSQLSTSPADAALYLLRSIVRTRQSQFELALSDAEKAAELSNNSPESQLRRAVNLWRLDRKPEAQALVSRFDDSPEAQTWRAIISARPANAPPTKAPPTEAPAPSAPQTPAKPSQTVRTDWYQSSTQVNLSVYRKNLDPHTPVTISPTEVRIDSPDLQYTQRVNTIDPAKSTYSITPYKVELTLHKSEPQTWKSLTELANSAQSAPAPTPTPTVQYKKWDQIADSDEEDSGDPMDFFQKLYSGADDATKRAMLKSYTESNGTALSTDWSQVGQQKVETVPPASMEAKQYN